MESPVTGVLIAVPCLETVSSKTAIGLYWAGSYFVSAGIPSAITMLQSSLITSARSRIANYFMASEFSHLLWIDSDIGFDAANLDELVQLANHFPFVAASYPKKIEKGNPKYSIEFRARDGILVEHELPVVGINSIGNGFQLVHRSVYESVAGSNPQLKWHPDDVINRDTTIPAGNIEIENSYHYYMETLTAGEDIAFCHRYIDSGGDIWLAKNINLSHIGSYDYKTDVTVNDIVERVRH